MLPLEKLDALDALVSRRAKTIASASILTVLFVKVVSKCLRTYLVRRYTVNHDLRYLGKERGDEKKIKGTAVICGGSIAGLWAARVCLDHFDDVVIIEPEAWIGTEKGMSPVYNEEGEFLGKIERSRVMQYNAGHAYQVPMIQALRNAFPGCEALLRKFGGRFDVAEHHLHHSGNFVPAPTYDYPEGEFPDSFFLTRESFELALRKLVRNHSARLRWITGTVTGLKTNAKDSTKISGVTVRTDGTDTDTEMKADLVVDCTGDTCAGSKWLQRWTGSLETDKKTTPMDDLRIAYNPSTNSMTFRFVVPPEMRAKLPLPGGYDDASWFYLFVANPDLEDRGCFASRIEGHRIEIVVASRGDQGLPTKPGQIRGFMESIRSETPLPDWLLDTTEMLSEVVDFTAFECAVPRCYWIHYEKALLLPSNFIAIGDAVMRVNPAFGQGCTKACLGAITLDAMLRRTPSLGPSFSKKFFAMHTDKIGGLWDGTKPADYGHSSTEPAKGETLEHGRNARMFLKHALKLIEKDKYINSVIWHVRMMMAPATDLMHPYILFRVAVEAVKERWGLS